MPRFTSAWNRVKGTSNRMPIGVLITGLIVCIGLIGLNARNAAPKHVTEIKLPTFERSSYTNQQLFDQLLEITPSKLNETAPIVHDSANLIIIVISHPGETEKREDIRRTWANKNNSMYMTKKMISIVFALGKKMPESTVILQESEKYGDILVLDVEDSYNNLLYKILAVHRWAHSFYPTSYIAKSDSDYILNPDRLYKLARENMYEEKWIRCHRFDDEKVRRDLTDKWHVPKSIYPFTHYPSYCNGAFYMMSPDALAGIMEEATKKFQIFEIEDVIYTGILAEKTGVRRIKNNNIHYWRPAHQECKNGRATVIGFPLWELTIQQGFDAMKKLPCVLSNGH